MRLSWILVDLGGYLEYDHTSVLEKAGFQSVSVGSGPPGEGRGGYGRPGSIRFVRSNNPISGVRWSGSVSSGLWKLVLINMTSYENYTDWMIIQTT